MAGMGPPPKHPSQKRRPSTSKLTQLPAEGRQGRAPKWPFVESTPTERKLWGELWKTPQAVLWERTHAHREVAAYVRWSLLAETGDIKAAPEARQLSDRLGLTPLALRRLECEIVADEVSTKREVIAEMSARARLSAVS